MHKKVELSSPSLHAQSCGYFALGVGVIAAQLSNYSVETVIPCQVTDMFLSFVMRYLTYAG